MNYVITDFSYMMDENLNRNPMGKLRQDWRSSPQNQLSMPVKIIEEGLKIPAKEYSHITQYLDTKIQYKDEFYYTQRRFLKEVEKTEYQHDEIDFNGFIEKHNYIGFMPDSWSFLDKDILKYMIITSGPQKGQAARPEGTWAEIKDQKNCKGIYYIFKTKNELLEWMKS